MIDSLLVDGTAPARRRDRELTRNWIWTPTASTLLAPCLVALLSLAGCASQSRTGASPVETAVRSPASVSGPDRWVREVATIPVVGPGDIPYASPFLGGLNVPRPQLVDIDHDGDFDLFVQEHPNRLSFFENVGEQELVWRTDDYADLEIGDWYRFTDLDDDGDVDLMAEAPFSHIRVYVNDGEPGSPHLRLAVDTLRNAGGDPIFSDRQNIPNATDIDCDGLIDLFIGRVTGTVYRYESVGPDEAGLPRFQLISEKYEDIEIVNQFVPGSMRHGANTLTFADVDLDGDNDLFWGDFFEPGLLLIENTGTCENPSLRSTPVPFPPNAPLATSGYNAPSVADLTGDGTLDVLVGVLGGAFNPNKSTTDNLYLLEGQTRDGREFVVETKQLVSMLDAGSESVPAFGDLDGDGDQDLLLANKIDPTSNNRGSVLHFENVGSSTAPRFAFVDTLGLAASFSHAPALGDLDGDGDLDMIDGAWNDQLSLYTNSGSPSRPMFELTDSEFLKLSRGSNARPTLTDIDDDGDLDLFVGESSGTINYFENTGSTTEARYTLVSDEYGDIDVGRRSFPRFKDMDGDGDLDLIVGTESAGVLTYTNVGTRSRPEWDESTPFDVDAPTYAAPDFVDIDSDGDLDLFLGGAGGGLQFYRNAR